MKYLVQLYVAGKVFDFTCFARDIREAKQVALAQYPNATVLRATATFK
jgi:hypothetical protein